MPSFINTNIASLNAQRNLNSSQASLHTSLQRLSSGLRVNSAKDDAAGMAIAARMDSQVRGLNQAARNANDGISLAQTAEGALGSIQANLARMRELAVQGANATSSGVNDIAAINNEYTQLQQEITRIISATKFNGTFLLDPAQVPATGLTFQIGADNIAANDQITITTAGITLLSGPTGNPPALTNQTDAQNALANLDSDIQSVANSRSTFGAVQSRFEAIINNIQITAENTSASKSRIIDADYAAETAALTRAQILQQAGTAMLAQANQSPNTVLQLLR